MLKWLRLDPQLRYGQQVMLDVRPSLKHPRQTPHHLLELVWRSRKAAPTASRDLRRLPYLHPSLLRCPLLHVNLDWNLHWLQFLPPWHPRVARQPRHCR